jgi:hypothetical protein
MGFLVDPEAGRQVGAAGGAHNSPFGLKQMRCRPRANLTSRTRPGYNTGLPSGIDPDYNL